jgi:DNA (cytosine-5)-methyltransferase 1
MKMASIANHTTRQYSEIILERFRHLPPGGKMGDLPSHLQHASFRRSGDKKTGGPNMRLLRLEMDKPSLTVTAYIFNKFVHPNQDRYITPREAACLQDFPEDWVFKGTLGQVHKQIGNAVPVKLATAVAGSVADYLVSIGHSGSVDVASYFSGAGGLDLGFELLADERIQFRTRFCSDIETWSEATINFNRPEWNFMRADIRDLDSDIVKSTIGRAPDVIIGGPPCQPFSVAGKQAATSDPLGRLYSDFVRQVAELQPKVVVMENVYGMAQVKSADMLSLVYESFETIGYHVTHRELLAADYGTPQLRRRLFFIAVKELHKYHFPYPSHGEQGNILGLKPYCGAGSAIINLPIPEFEDVLVQ